MTPIDTIVLKRNKIWLTGNLWNRVLFTRQKKFATVATAQILSKICQGQPQQCTQSAPDFIQINSLSAKL